MAGSQAPVPEPDVVLGPGARDAALLSALWLLRRSVWTLLWLGVIGLVLAGELDAATDLETPEITSAADIREAATSPRILLFLAPVARFGSGWLALAVTFPFARRFERAAARDIGRTRRHPVAWSDRWFLMQALRSWRWTSAVRRLARSRLGRAGTAILVADITLLVAGIVLFPVAFVVLVRALS
jgi:hypothetical protein